MNKQQNHHYVPRCYFKPWEDRYRYVNVYERKNSQIYGPYRQSTEVICAKTNLYSYSASVEESKRHLIETKLFKLIDDKAAKILTKLISQNDKIDLTEDETVYFSIFLLSLRVRTPEYFETTAAKGELTLRKSLMDAQTDPKYEDVRSQLGQKTILKYAEENHLDIIENKGKEILSKFIMDEKYYNNIRDLHWAVTTIDGEERNTFLTSDRPLIWQPRGNEVFFVALPISPTKLFMAAKENQSIENIIRCSHKKRAELTNISVIQQAESKAFAKDRSHLVRFFKNRLAIEHDLMPRPQIGEL